MGKHIGQRKKRELRARAVKVEEEEYQQEITNKLRERLQRQDTYRETRLLRVSQEAKIVAADKAITLAKKNKKEVVDWYDTPHPIPIDILITERNKLLNTMKTNLTQEVYLKQALFNDGLVEKDIKLVEQGKYNKDEKEVDKPKKERSDYIG